jgi:hypothetical protein
MLSKQLEMFSPNLHRLERMCCCNGPTCSDAAGNESAAFVSCVDDIYWGWKPYPRVVAMLFLPFCSQKGCVVGVIAPAWRSLWRGVLTALKADYLFTV